MWKNKNLTLTEDQLKFYGNDSLPSEFLDMSSTYKCFQYFFSDDLLQMIVDESNLYSIQTNISKPLNLNLSELKQYIGIIIYMSVLRLPNVRSYWSPEFEITSVKNCMTTNRFEKIRQFIHFNDNTKHLPQGNHSHDRLHKIRPLIDHLNLKCSKVPLEAHLSVDEQLCSTKVSHFLKQYIPMKPFKWGFKLFVLCGVSGFAYKFEVYSGQENKRAEIDQPDLGASANVVVRLSTIIPANKNYRLYFDNYYTSPALLAYLAKKGILSLGTVRRNRIPDCKLPTEKVINKDARGTSYEFVGEVDGIEISSLVWKDNKAVSLLSTYAGQLPLTTINRFDKKTKKKIDISCPFVIKEYNHHMGGVDLMDGIIARHKIVLKSKKWYMRLFYHFIDMTLANSWILNNRVLSSNQNYQEKMTFFEFRKELSFCLMKVGQKNTIKRDRPSISMLEEMMEAKKKSKLSQFAPPKEVRLDQVGHWITWTDGRVRCKLPKCKGYAQTLCEKCGVHLCCNKKNNCFKTYHASE